MSIRSNPFEEIERFFERMSRQFDEVTRTWEGDGPLGQWAGAVDMAVDLVEHDEAFVATVDLPGFERDDVDVEVTDHVLRIEAEHEEHVEETDDEEDAERYLRQERRHRSARRSIRLPEEVDTEAVTARMNNGVLTITLPKREVEPARSVDIDVE